jgi:hypothetical protein
MMSLLSVAHQSLLQAAFLSGPQAIAAWETWKNNSDFENLDWESYQLLPRLYHNLECHGIQDPLMSRMKGVRRLFWCKNQTSLSALETAISTIQGNGISIRLLSSPGSELGINQGMALSDDVKFQIQINHLDQILSILESLGWHSKSPNLLATLNYAGALHLSHETHPAITVYTGFSAWCPAFELMQDCWNQSQSQRIGDTEVQVWHVVHQVLFNAIPIRSGHPPQSFHLPLTQLARLILLLRNPDLCWSQLLETAAHYSFLAPLQHGLDVVQHLQIELPADSQKIRSYKTPRIEQWEYHFILHPKPHLLARGIGRLARSDRRSHISAQLVSCSLDLNLEWQILWACSLMHCDRPQVQKIKQLLAQPIDWPKLLQLASEHKVSALIGKTLETHVPERIPETIRKMFLINQRGNRLRNISLTFALDKILGVLKENGIIAIPYKGPTLTQLAYQDFSVRKFNDLDLLIAPQDFEDAKVCLAAQGYIKQLDFGWEESWSHEQENIEIDLHKALAPETMSSLLTHAYLIGKLKTISFQENELKNIAILTIDCEMLFILLSIYMVKDHCSWKFRLYQISDVAALVQNHPGIDWNVVLEVGKRLGLLRIILLQLQILNTIYGLEIPSTFKSFYQKDLSIRKLSQEIIQRLTALEDAVPSGFGFAFTLRHSDHYFYLRSRERWCERISYLLIWFREIFVFFLLPNQADYNLMKFPQWGQFLYYPLHISRLLWKYTIALRSVPPYK